MGVYLKCAQCTVFPNKYWDTLEIIEEYILLHKRKKHSSKWCFI